MKRIKVVIMTLAILLSIGGAFATRPQLECYGYQQYKKVAGGYVPCGEMGYNFDCLSSSNVCTYWINIHTGLYEACHMGTYAFIQLTDNKKKK